MRVSISVITVTLNAKDRLPRLFDSLRRQSDRNFDFVVVDGASTDGTWDLVENAPDIVTRSISEIDSGFYDALNKGIRLATTDYYLVVGADDVLDKNAIANFREATDKGSVDVIVANVKAGGSVRRGFNRNKSWLGHAAMVTSHSVGMLLRTDLHASFGMYSLRYPLLADGYFIKRICASASVRISSADFLAGEFCIAGMSNRNMPRVLCETWLIQMDTGENALVQYLLFQLRLLRYLPDILLNRHRTSSQPIRAGMTANHPAKDRDSR